MTPKTADLAGKGPTVSPAGPACPAETPGARWLTVLCAIVLVAAAGWILHRGLGQLRWAVELSREGSPPPSLDEASVSGYTAGQRAFLGTVERGETYRWIAATQTWLADGTLPQVYTQDNAPEGRHHLLPRPYLAWLAGLSSAIHLVSGASTARAVEQAALWEPIVAHLLFFGFAGFFTWTRHGPLAALLTGAVIAFFPPLSAQFIPGVLTARTAALLFAASGIVLQLSQFSPRSGNRQGTAFLLGLALWLDPAFGFPAILLSTVMVAASRQDGASARQALLASFAGAAWTSLAWLIDGAVSDPAAGELRSIHPLYSAAWAGLGLLAHGWHRLNTASSLRKGALLEFAFGAVLVVPLAYTQAANGYAGWLFSSAAMRRLTSFDEGVFHSHLFAWLTQAPALELLYGLSIPLLAAALLVSAHWARTPATAAVRRQSLFWTALGTALALSFLHVRWIVPTGLVGLGVIVLAATTAPSRVRASFHGGLLLLCLLGAVAASSLPAALQRRTDPQAPDIEALVYRHFSHWLSSHSGGEPVLALAPPALSDSLVFHGNVSVLLSTAWQSYPGHLAASRILSAPEWSETQAVLESRRVTHLILPSWDKVLPLMVQAPPENRDTAYARLQRWLLPLYLRPIPYHLPNTPGYEDQKVAVFQVTAPQDEALALARLAEYFVEMDRPEPARLVAEVLAGTFPDDLNAATARALVAAHGRDNDGFARALSLLAAPLGENVVISWDRRVQRAIALALGRRGQLAQRELASCAESARREDLLELTPLQAHRLGVLMKRLNLQFADPGLDRLLQAQGAEYADSASG